MLGDISFHQADVLLVRGVYSMVLKVIKSVAPGLEKTCDVQAGWIVLWMARERMMPVLVDQDICTHAVGRQRKDVVDLSERWKAVDELGQNLM